MQEDSLAAPGRPRVARVRAVRPRGEPDTVVLVFSGRIGRADIPRLCERARGLLQAGDADRVVCDVSAVVDPDAAALDALARLQLTARRLGHVVRVRHACIELQELLTLTGLDVVVPQYVELPLETSRQAEEREQPGGVEKEGDPGDLPV
jgi:ABC-type transporter Mla MlaB component